MTLRPGDHLGPYRVEETLGSGGMGEVVLAYDDRLGRHVAIKRIRHDRQAAQGARARFRREARAAASLSHPSIVQVFDILSQGDEDAIVMEYVPGVSVAEKLRAGPLPLASALEIAREVAAGLDEAHRAGLVHRDLKAENVILPPRGPAKILDFGLAKSFAKAAGEDSLTREGVFLGTVRSASPEQAGGREAGPRSDLYSLGVLLYETLAGKSPFRGANALETLRQVLTLPPPDLRELRPEVPPRLAELVGRLLEKDPDDRPENAREVLEVLDAVAGELASGGEGELREMASGDLGSLSDLPTGSLGVPNPPDDPGRTAPEQGQGLPKQPLWRPKRTAVRAGASLILLLAAVLAIVYLPEGWPPGAGGRKILRVAVMAPEIQGDEGSPELGFLASGLSIAALRTLRDLEGVTPLAPPDRWQAAGSPEEVARALAADEVLRLALTPGPGGARITLERIRGADGEVLWTRKLEAPLRPSASRWVAEALSARLQAAFPDRPLRPGSRRLEVGDEEYRTFVEISQRLDSGGTSLEGELGRLERLAGRAPHFLEVHQTGAATALALFSGTGDPGALDRAETLLRLARQLAPDLPGPIQEELRLALARGDEAAAEEALGELDRVSPHSVEGLLGRSDLAMHRGDLAAAEELQQRAVERWPTWRSLYDLADLQRRRGDVEGARRTLERLVERSPSNPWGLGKLAQLELLYGDLGRAEALLLRAIEVRPHRSYHTNLGLVRFLLGRYGEARSSYLQALAQAPDHRTVRLNLADTELALGNEAAAAKLYRELAESFEEEPRRAADRMTLAQCLARLGEGRRAVALTLETLQAQPEDSEVAYQAALVYALVGETDSALVNVEKALARGVGPRWFGVPGFETLATDPAFRDLLESAPRR